jgi:phage regulator Rha-like protein
MESISIIENKILMIRGQRVMLDADLAFLYGVPTKRLNEQVQRNIQRFPGDFMFQLTKEEAERLKSQFATSNVGRGGKRKLPYVFTEHGVAMLSSVLRSEKAVEMNIFIIRAFIKMRELLATNKDLAYKVEKMEGHIIDIISVLKRLTDEPLKPKGKVGFSLL